MGSPEDEIGHSSSESPQHEVNIATFFMSKYPITQTQWQFIAGLQKISRDLNPDVSTFKGDNYPVEEVSWYDAVEFCHRLSQHTHREYRLPTEAQWEYACRAGTVTPFHFGETITTNLSNYDGTNGPDGQLSGAYGRGPKGEYRRKPTPVNYFGIANSFGLCDMHGNVFEWCLDHWHNNYSNAPEDGSAWLSSGENVKRVLRGGSWSSKPNNCRSAYRVNVSPIGKSSNFGFRVVYWNLEMS